MSEITIRKASSDDIEQIRFYIKEFTLDDEGLDPEHFIVAEVDNELAGFGRIKSYQTMQELCSVGVREKYRKLGVGEKIVRRLIDIFPSDKVWLTTKKIDYFKKLGFKVADDPPKELIGKNHRICEKYNGPVDEMTYMVLEKR